MLDYLYIITCVDTQQLIFFALTLKLTHKMMVKCRLPIPQLMRLWSVISSDLPIKEKHPRSVINFRNVNSMTKKYKFTFKCLKTLLT